MAIGRAHAGGSRRRAVGSTLAALLVTVPFVPLGPLVAPAAAVTAPFGTGECAQQVSAGGDLIGAVAVDGVDCVVAFKGGSGAWVVPQVVTGIRYLVVGGGGAGGSRGGGGAGAFFETAGTTLATPGASIDVMVGSGGAAGSARVAGGNGTPSVFGGVTAYGGGGGTSSPQYDRLSLRNALPDPTDGTDLAARPVYAASFTNGEGGSGGGGQASPVHDWFAPTNDVRATELTALGSDDRGGLGRPAGSAGEGLLRHEGGDAQSVFHLFSDGRVRSFWIGGGGGGAGGPGADAAWASEGASIEDVIASDGQVITLTGPGFVPGAGGAGRSSGLLSTAVATTLAIGESSVGAVYFAGGGGGFANYHNPAETGEPSDVASLLTAKNLGGAPGVGGGGRGAGLANTGGGGRGGGAGGSGVVLVRYTRAAQAPLDITPRSATFGTPVTLDPTGGSGSGDVTIAMVDTDEPCTLSGTILTPTSETGTCAIAITRAGDASYVERTDIVDVSLGVVDPDGSSDAVRVAGGQGLALTCRPPSDAPSSSVTCDVSGGDPGLELFWQASTGAGPFTGGGVSLGTDGLGRFTFPLPDAVIGAAVTVELVGWGVVTTVRATRPIPIRMETGGGLPVALSPEHLMLMLLLTVALLIALHGGAISFEPRGRAVVVAVPRAPTLPLQRSLTGDRPDLGAALAGFDVLHARLDVLRASIASE